MGARISKRDKEIIKRADFLRGVLAEFGVRLIGFDPGVLGSIEPECRHIIDMDSHEWRWLEPLLVELREYRQKARGEVCPPTP